MMILLLTGLVGLVLRKRGFVRDCDRGCFAMLVSKVALPSTILYCFVTCEDTTGLGLGIFLSLFGYAMICVFSYGVGCVTAKLFRCPEEQKGVWLFGSIFSNGGNLGLVVLSALYEGPVLIYASFLVFAAIFTQTTVGLNILTKHGGREAKRRSVKSMLLDPSVLAGFIGCLIMVLRVPVPDFCTETLHALKGMTAPLCMLLIGASIADSKLSALKNPHLYLLSLLRALVIPMLVFLLLFRLPIETAVIVNLVMRTAMPFASNTAIFSEQTGNDTLFASQATFLSTLLSIVTIPLFVSMLSLIG